MLHRIARQTHAVVAVAGDVEGNAAVARGKHAAGTVDDELDIDGVQRAFGDGPGVGLGHRHVVDHRDRDVVQRRRLVRSRAAGVDDLDTAAEIDGDHIFHRIDRVIDRRVQREVIRARGRQRDRKHGGIARAERSDAAAVAVRIADQRRRIELMVQNRITAREHRPIGDGLHRRNAGERREREGQRTVCTAGDGARKIAADRVGHRIQETRPVLVGIEAVLVGGVFDAARKAMLFLDRAGHRIERQQRVGVRDVDDLGRLGDVAVSVRDLIREAAGLIRR